MTILVRLAHISDLHLTQVPVIPPMPWNFKRCLGYLNWFRLRRRLHSRVIADKILKDVWRENVDHLAITGDIAHLGLQSEHADAQSWLKKQEFPERITFVPGNHDIYSHWIDRQSCLQSYKEFMTSDEASKFFLSSSSAEFPFLRRLGSIALIGLNSAVPTKPFRADGCLGDDQLAALDILLSRLKEKGLFRVLLIHHPPIPGLTASRRALKDAYQLQEILKARGAELILHGHNHKASVEWLESLTGPSIPIIGVGSGSAAFTRASELLASYHLFEFSIEDGSHKIKMTTRGLNTTEGDVVELHCLPLWPRVLLS